MTEGSDWSIGKISRMTSMNDVSTEELQAFKAAFFRALAHPVRIRILELLVRKDSSVQELQEALGVEQPVVSQQLAVLRTTNIVAGKKEGVSVRYAVRDPLMGAPANDHTDRSCSFPKAVFRGSCRTSTCSSPTGVALPQW